MKKILFVSARNPFSGRYSGDVIMLSTGKLSKQQQKVAERMLISADNHSIVLRIVISLEILFEKI